MGFVIDDKLVESVMLGTATAGDILTKARDISNDSEFINAMINLKKKVSENEFLSVFRRFMELIKVPRDLEDRICNNGFLAREYGKIKSSVMELNARYHGNVSHTKKIIEQNFPDNILYTSKNFIEKDGTIFGYAIKNSLKDLRYSFLGNTEFDIFIGMDEYGKSNEMVKLEFNPEKVFLVRGMGNIVRNLHISSALIGIENDESNKIIEGKVENVWRKI